VQFPSPNVGYIVGINPSIGGGILLKTTDGGESWASIDLGDPSYIIDISCVSEDVFYITCENSFKKTINGGASFETTAPVVGKLQFINEQIGYAPGDHSILKTIDGGNTWLPVHTFNYIQSIYFLDENIGFVNDSGELYKTTDGGNTFTYLDTISSNIDKLFATTANVVWGVPVLCPLNGSPCYSIRGEITGPGEFERTDGVEFRSIYFASPTIGYAVLGDVFKNSTGLMLGVNKVDKKDAVKIYPNPASDQITIAFDETPAQPFAIEITDCLGKKIYSRSFQAENFATINIASFSKGFYFLTVVSQQQRQTQKIIVN
jgi:hypothetical protein